MPSYKLTDVSHLRTYVTLVRNIEVDRIKASVKSSNYFSVIFDRSSRVDEVLAVILRYVTKGNCIYNDDIISYHIKLKSSFSQSLPDGLSSQILLLFKTSSI
jgi:hypothetical protein